jgi:hypothetical protein
MITLSNDNRFNYEIGDLLRWNSLYSSVSIGLVVKKDCDGDDIHYDILWNHDPCVYLNEKRIETYSTYDLGFWHRIERV